MEKPNSFNKQDSMALKGIAIMMMLFHHLYCTTGRFSAYKVSFYPFEQDTIVSLSLFMKICVSIFAFITGYGLLKTISHLPKPPSKTISQKDAVIWSSERLLKTMGGYYFIYILAFIVTMAIDRMPLNVYFSGSKTAGAVYMLTDFLGLHNLFGTPTLCATWWYMSAAILFVLLVPVFFTISRKVGYLPIVIGVIALPRLLQIDYPGSINPYSFILSLLFGMMSADYNLFERVENRLPKNKPVAYIVSFLVFGGFVAAFYRIGLNIPAYKSYELNWGVAPVFCILFFRFNVVRIPVLKQLLSFLGKHSMTIFLTHTFIRYTYLESFIYSFGNFLKIYIVLFSFSLILALLIDGFKALIRFDYFYGKLTARMTGSINRLLFDKEK